MRNGPVILFTHSISVTVTIIQSLHEEVTDAIFALSQKLADTQIFNWLTVHKDDGLTLSIPHEGRYSNCVLTHWLVMLL